MFLFQFSRFAVIYPVVRVSIFLLSRVCVFLFLPVVKMFWYSACSILLECWVFQNLLEDGIVTHPAMYETNLHNEIWYFEVVASSKHVHKSDLWHKSHGACIWHALTAGGTFLPNNIKKRLWLFKLQLGKGINNQFFFTLDLWPSPSDRFMGHVGYKPSHQYEHFYKVIWRYDNYLCGYGPDKV